MPTVSEHISAMGQRKEKYRLNSGITDCLCLGVFQLNWHGVTEKDVSAIVLKSIHFLADNIGSKRNESTLVQKYHGLWIYTLYLLLK